MNYVARLAAAVAGLVVILGSTPSWGGPPNPTASDANFNTAGGTDAVQNVVGGFPFNGHSNTGFGFRALVSTTDGTNNTATGARALEVNTTGRSNTAIGALALFNANGFNNTAIGAAALLSNIIGGSNTATGAGALGSNTMGESNTASGAEALFSNTTGNKNTALGVAALRNSTGTLNIAVGHEAGITLVSGKHNIYLGHPGAGTESKTMRLGNVQTQTFIAGVATAAVTGTPVVIDANGQLGTQLSSARYKQDIATMGARSAALHELRPVTFVYRGDGQLLPQYGLIAEEVATVYPELVTRTAAGEVNAVRYQELIPMLLNELQRQKQETEAQKLEAEAQRRELAALRSLVEQMRGSVVGR